MPIFYRGLASIAFLFLFSSCNNDLKDYSRLEGLRVLALVADKPEVNTAGPIQIQPFISYPEGGSTTLDVSYEVCLDPGIDRGADLECKTQQGIAPVQDSYTDTTALLGATNYFTGGITPFSISVTPIMIGALSLIHI